MSTNAEFYVPGEDDPHLIFGVSSLPAIGDDVGIQGEVYTVASITWQVTAAGPNIFSEGMIVAMVRLK